MRLENAILALSSSAPWEWGGNAAATIRAAIADEALPIEVRSVAAKVAGDMVVMDEDMAQALLPVLRNRSTAETLRSAAAISFGPVLESIDSDDYDDPSGLEDPPLTRELYNEVRATLRCVFEDEAEPKSVRRRALEASVRCTEPWHEQAVRAALAERDPEWRLTGVFCTSYVRGDFSREILDALNSDDEELLTEALVAAGANEIAESWPRVSEFLRSRNAPRTLRLAAIEAAGGIASEEAIEALEKLATSRDEEIAEAAQEAMMMARLQFDGELNADEVD